MSASNTNAVMLQDLVGEHIMDITPTTDIKHPFDSDANGIDFSLDGIIYMAFENPDDGYRSYLGALLAFKGEAYSLGWKNYEYVRRKVTCVYRDKSEYGVAELLDIIDVETGKLWVSVGTDNSDDYYPFFVGRITPIERDKS